MRLQLLCVHLRVVIRFTLTESLRLQLPCARNTLANNHTALARTLLMQARKRHRCHFNMQINAIQQRATHLAQITLHHTRSTCAFLFRMIKIAARTGVHGGHQHKARWILNTEFTARNSYVAIFQRLTHNFQHRALEFRQFIQKQNTVVRQRNFTRLRVRSSAHERDVCCSIKV